MFITEVVSKGKKGKSYTSILLRQSFRLGSKVKSKTIAVLTHLPANIQDAIRYAVAKPSNSHSSGQRLGPRGFARTGKTLRHRTDSRRERKSSSPPSARTHRAPEATVGCLEAGPANHGAGSRSERSHAQENLEGA